MSLLFCLILINIIFVINGDIDCSDDDSCQHGEYTCENDCNIDCTGENSCLASSFTCKNSCTIKCDAYIACDDTIFFLYGNETKITCNSEFTCQSNSFIGNREAAITIECNGKDSCSYSGIVLYDESTLNTTCNGNDSCEDIVCQCIGNPNCKTSGNINCGY